MSEELTEHRSAIRVYGARTHNLREINVEIPIGSMTVITGVSGSGKSSLAFDTIFAEGRHRYLSSLSMRSRELLQTIDRPDVDFIDALPPVLCVEQRMRGARNRSTVATASDIYDFLRLLFARIGQLSCPTCARPVIAQSRAEIVDQTLEIPDRQKLIILAPIIRAQAGKHSEVFTRIVKAGYLRARVDGQIIDASDPPELDPAKSHDIEIVVDRLVMKQGIETRLEESIDLALQLGEGRCGLSRETDAGWDDRFYSTILACTVCGTRFPPIEPRTFSFNSALGACSKCHGTGILCESDESERPCDDCQGSRLGPIPRSVLIDGISISEFCAKSPADALQVVEAWKTHHSAIAHSSDPTRSATTSAPADRLAAAANSTHQGHSGLELHSPRQVALKHILPEIAARLRCVIEVGLNYLTLDRSCATLSAGELQRTRLSACLGSELTGVCYILDEPTAGLHSRDTQRLLTTLIRLKEQGNTVLLVEHDLDVIRQADHVIDLGPGAGSLGGLVLASGTPTELERNPDSVTGRFLTNDPFPQEDKTPKESTETIDTSTCLRSSPCLALRGATLHNLNDVTIEIPLQRIVCVTGVSGSGKTSLVMQTLVPAVQIALGARGLAGGPFHELSGVEDISKLVRVDQSPLGRSARSSPATYSGLWDDIRQIFAKTKESRIRGFTARRFSLSVPEARCPRCAGRGQLPIEEQRLTDWNIRCPECDGRRYSPATLSVRYRGKTVADVLNMSLLDAAQFFENFPRLANSLNVFNELGLGYLKLGQSATTLSGGEAQRIKLGTELARSTGDGGSTLFVLDEPTSGLHVADVLQLVAVLRKLVDGGNTVLVIEHNRELIARSDWIIEIGPGAGVDGGNVVFAGIRR